MWLRPTSRWNKKIAVPVGGGGIYRAQFGQEVFALEDVANWLVENQYAVLSEGDNSQSSDVPEIPEVIKPALELWQAWAINLLETSPEEVKGIPSEILESIAALPRPLLWEEVEALLRPKQLQTLKKIAEEHDKL